MTALIRRAADRFLSDRAKLLIRRSAKRMRSAFRVGLTIGHAGTAQQTMTAAFAPFEPREGTRHANLRALASLAVLLRGHARHDARFFDALLKAAGEAEARLRPAPLQSYVDVSVRTAAIRAFADHVARQRRSGDESEALFTALALHAPDDRAVLLAHADFLADRARLAEAEPLIRRALRMNAVCQTAQRLLARVIGDDYDLSDKFCPMPFTHLSTSYKADAFACCCSAWLPFPVGNVLDAASAEDVWNSAGAREIRRSIHDGDFSYCSRTLCSYIAARTLPKKADVADAVLRGYIDERAVVIDRPPDMLQMNHDPSCNLACPSCRTSVVTAGPKEQRTYLDAADRVLLPLLRRVEGQTYISGGGEAFASAHYRKLLKMLNRRDFPGLSIYLISNGQLINARRWAEFPDLPEMIGVLSISVDAARADTYEQLRRPGKWSVLMDNLQFISGLRADGVIPELHVNFVVQAANFREIPEFIAMGVRLGADRVWLQRLTNYGSYDEALFGELDVTSERHPGHDELLAILRPYVGHPLVNMDMLLPLFPEVVETEAANPLLRRRGRIELSALA